MKTRIPTFEDVRAKYRYLTHENYVRMLLLFFGVKNGEETSFPDVFTRIEVIFTLDRYSKLPILTLYDPDSPFTVVADGTRGVLMQNGAFFANLQDYNVTKYDMHNDEPFYFFVREINNDLVLKVNPIQLCNFFRSRDGNMPCIFCFRNDMVGRFRNITAKKLLDAISQDTHAQSLLPVLDEVSLITGSYQTNDEYLAEVTAIVKGLKKYIPRACRIVVGSYEANTKKAHETLKKAGVSHFAYPVESMSDGMRSKFMRNRKGSVPIEDILKGIKTAVNVFGEDGVIVRLVAGMGDTLDALFNSRVERIRAFGKSGKGPLWNINIYMPFTHYHWHIFHTNRPYDLEYIFNYVSRINKYIDQSRQYRFKVSP